MPVCVDISSGQVVVANPQPADLSNCSAVVLSGAEFQGLATADIFNISVADGLTIATAIVGVWAIGWVFRALILTLKETDKGVEND
jgi:hypothetical protein